MEIVVSCIGIFLVSSILVAVFLPIELLGREKAHILVTVGDSTLGIWLAVMISSMLCFMFIMEKKEF